MNAFGHDAAVFFRGGIDIEPDDPLARGHEHPDVAIAQAKHPFHHLLLGFLEHAGHRSLADQELDFFLGDGGLG